MDRTKAKFLCLMYVHLFSAREMSFAGVCRFMAERFFYICLSVYLTCLLVTITPIFAAPTCPPIADLHKVGFCLNGSYHEWDCMNCPHGLGLSVECGKVYYDKVIKVECQPCKNGTYSENNDFGQCKPCSHCQENEVQSGECKADKDTIRCTGVCKTGYYKAQGICKPCSWCCGDKTNEYVDECRNLQKKCSFQDIKSCGPTTTPSPTTVPTGSASTTSSTKNSSSTSSIPTEMATPTTKKSSVLSSPNTTETSNDSAETKNDSTNPTRSGEKEWDGHKIILAIVAVLLTLFIIGLIVGIYYFCRSGNSSGGTSDSEQGSMSTCNESSSSALLISEAKEKEKSTHENNGENIQLCSRPERAPLLHSTPVNQGKDLEDPATGTITGRDDSCDTLESSTTCTCMNTPTPCNIQDDTENHNESTRRQLSNGRNDSCDALENFATCSCMNPPNIQDDDTENPIGINTTAGTLSRKRKLDLLVTNLPRKIYGKVCSRLDTEDHFFHDYRMLGEELGVSVEDVKAYQNNQTDSLFIKCKPNVGKLMDILKIIEREDVMEIVEEWLNQ